MIGDTKKAALGAVKNAEDAIRAIPQAITVGMVVAVIKALFAVVSALRCTLDHVDAIELP